MSTVLFVASHPDDELLGPGATLARHVADGDDVHVLVVTRARGGRSTSDLVAEALSRLGAGTKHVTPSLEYMTLDREPLATNDHVERMVRDVEPDVVYTHHPADLNADHRTVSQAVLVATRPGHGPPVRRLLAFETPSSTEWGGEALCLAPFRPDVFICVDEDLMRRKLDALRVYSHEIRQYPHPRSLEMVESRALYWGQVAGLPLAEPFQLIREVVA